MAEPLPNRIRELRKARGLTLERMADRVGCAVSMMSNLERGERDLTMHWMKRVARVLKVQVGDLLAERDNSRSLTAGEHELLDLYGRAEPEQQAQLLQMARILVGPAPRLKSVA